MPQVAIPNTTRAVARLIRGGEEIVNVWHITHAVGLSPTQRIALRQAFVTFYAGQSTAAAPGRGIQSHLDAGVIVDRVSSQFVGAVPYSDPEETIVGVAGALAGDTLPLQTSLCVSLRTGLANRRSRGRVYLGGFAEDGNVDTADGFPRPSAALITAVSNAMKDLDTNLNAIAADVQLAVASRLDLVSRPVTAVRVKNTWATQRRRTERVPITSTTQTAF